MTEVYFRWRNLDLTTPDVIANCEDLKVLGKGDFKALIRWRSALREEVHRHCKTVGPHMIPNGSPLAWIGCKD
jgi:AdoMet-dependent rRNA methyltransferase SPB1